MGKYIIASIIGALLGYIYYKKLDVPVEHVQ